MTMLFSLATSWTQELVKNVTTLNESASTGRVFELFGSLPYSLTGSGRAGHHLPKITEKDLTAHLDTVRSAGLEFNYIMNAPDFDGKEHDEGWLKALREHIVFLQQIGVTRVTIANPFLIQFVCKEFPELHVNVSVITGVDTPDRAKHYEQVGVECITLNQHTVNRDFKTLMAIRESVQCKLELLANTGCLDHCPNRENHYKANARLSRLDAHNDTITSAKQLANDCLRWCTHRLVMNPIEMLKIPFIRPEDVSVYEQIGIDILKIAGRRRKTDWLTCMAKAYITQRYHGNILDMVYVSSINKNVGLFCEHAEDYTIKFAIDNQKLTTYEFIDNIMRFTGDARERYYSSILADVVSGYDHPDVRTIQEQCRNSHISVATKS
jgi:collagenase-like PrtC family protease